MGLNGPQVITLWEEKNSEVSPYLLDDRFQSVAKIEEESFFFSPTFLSYL
jgi:hypothetical protein